MTPHPMDVLPIWGLSGLTIGVVLLSIEAGYRLGRYRRQQAVDEMEAPVNGIVAATLGLLGLILAFTFGLSASRFDAKRQVVVEEANAIGTTYLRAGLLPDGKGDTIRDILEAYVDARLEVVKTRDIELVLKRSEEHHRSLWMEAEAVGLQHPDSIVVGLFIESLNETIDVHSKRVLIALRSRLPLVLWVILFLETIVTMMGVGYVEGLSRSKRSPAVLVLVLGFSAIIMLIADLDGSQDGMLTVSQQALIDLRSTMDDIR